MQGELSTLQVCFAKEIRDQRSAGRGSVAFKSLIKASWRLHNAVTRYRKPGLPRLIRRRASSWVPDGLEGPS